MDVNELEKWIETEQGQTWLEARKKGLLDKQAELLEKVTKGNAENKTLYERIEGLESELSKSQAVVTDTLLSRPLANKLKEKGVFEVLIPELSKTIAETYGLQLADGNAAGKVTENGKETVLNLDQVIEHWSKTDQSKDCFRPQEVKTQSTSPDFKGGGAAVDRELAAMRRGAGLPEKE
jgi:hypothetical protein